MIELKNVSKIYNGKVIFEDVNLIIENTKPPAMLGRIV